MYLLWTMNYDFSPALIGSDGALNFNLPAIQRLHISEFILVRGKNDAGKRAVLIILAEIQKTISSPRSENPEQPSGNATRFADMRGRIMEVHASRCGLGLAWL